MTKDIIFWQRVLSNLKKHRDRPYVNELISNVERNISDLQK